MRLNSVLPMRVTLAVPASLQSITAYVLLEQEDWFEKEMNFLRRWLRPGMTVIDIGANLGVYSLPMARLVGPKGQVFAYEPASETRSLLEHSRELNAGANLHILPLALSDRERVGRLVFGGSSELNALGENGAGETVRITSLDREDAMRGWPSPDFIKIDAEGEEERILAGGQNFFARHSPLVMFEIKAGQQINESSARFFPRSAIACTGNLATRRSWSRTTCGKRLMDSNSIYSPRNLIVLAPCRGKDSSLRKFRPGHRARMILKNQRRSGAVRNLCQQLKYRLAAMGRPQIWTTATALRPMLHGVHRISRWRRAARPSHLRYVICARRAPARRRPDDCRPSPVSPAKPARVAKASRCCNASLGLCKAANSASPRRFCRQARASTMSLWRSARQLVRQRRRRAI